MVFRSPESAYHWLMARVRAPDRELLARREVRASLLAAMGEGLRPGVDGAAQDRVPLKHESEGPCYLRVRSTAETFETGGVLLERVSVRLAP